VVAQFSALLLRYEFSNDHLAFMALLVDSYEFTSTCLERQIEDVNSLESGMCHLCCEFFVILLLTHDFLVYDFLVMGHISAIRAEKVSTNLSLIATVFLPVTFLASAFGMNFEKNGDYTMSILNSPQVC
jgi:predicted glycosyltransferase involved in capsule biosynthesis